MRFDVLTIFPEFFDSPLRSGVVGKAMESGRTQCAIHNIRDWTTDRHRCTDDAPYGGGGGMVMLAEPLLRAIREVRERATEAMGERPPLIYLSPQGQSLDSKLVREFAGMRGMLLLCGNYEGIDERVVELEVDREVSIGDYVLTGGEIPALVLINAVARQLEGVLGNPTSAPNDSFENGLLDWPHYTRPERIEGIAVPEVLMSGHHARIEGWRRQQALERTARRRPELLLTAHITNEERRWLMEMGLWPEGGTR